jgi:hypothetical protein
VSVRQALRTRADDAVRVIVKMDVLGVWEAVRASDMTAAERAGVIRPSMFFKMKTHPDWSFDRYKARLVADKKLYEDLSSPTVSTTRCSLFHCIRCFFVRGDMPHAGAAYLTHNHRLFLSVASIAFPASEVIKINI